LIGTVDFVGNLLCTLETVLYYLVIQLSGQFLRLSDMICFIREQLKLLTYLLIYVPTQGN